jgi:hypothetical protein
VTYGGLQWHSLTTLTLYHPRDGDANLASVINWFLVCHHDAMRHLTLHHLYNHAAFTNSSAAILFIRCLPPKLTHLHLYHAHDLWEWITDDKPIPRDDDASTPSIPWRCRDTLTHLYIDTMVISKQPTPTKKRLTQAERAVQKKEFHAKDSDDNDNYYIIKMIAKQLPHVTHLTLLSMEDQLTMYDMRRLRRLPLQSLTCSLYERTVMSTIINNWHHSLTSLTLRVKDGEGSTHLALLQALLTRFHHLTHLRRLALYVHNSRLDGLSNNILIHLATFARVMPRLAVIEIVRNTSKFAIPLHLVATSATDRSIILMNIYSALIIDFFFLSLQNNDRSNLQIHNECLA